MFEVSEVVVLVLAVVLTPIMLAVLRDMPQVRNRYARIGYASMLVGYVLTILEGRYLPDFLNAIEHTAYAVGGVMAVAAILTYRRSGLGDADDA